MERLRTRDLRGMVEFLMDGYGVGDLDAFACHLMRALPRLVPCLSVSYNEINPRLDRINWIAEPDEATRFPGCEEIVNRHIGEHPVCRETVRTGKAEWARLSDFLTRRQLAALPLYQDFYRHVGTHHQVGVMYPPEDSVSKAIAINRDVRDFSDRERLLLNVLRSHILRGYSNAEALTRMRHRLALLNRGIEYARLGLVALASDGRIAMTTDSARRWLHAYLGWKTSSRRLPPTLQAWKDRHRVDRSPSGEVPPLATPFRVTLSDRTLTVRLLVEVGKETLVLREKRRGVDTTAFEADGLTRREAEVLGWVAQGKTSPEIAVILGLSVRTVHHHLDRIYRKLGVETRTAAARLALERAGIDD